MFPVVGGALRLSMVCSGVEQTVLEQPERSMVGVAEPSAGFDDLVKHRLQPGGLRHGPENAADRALLLAEILELTSQLRVIPAGNSHLKSLFRPVLPAAWSRRPSDPD